MSFLDLYQGEQSRALRPQANEATKLPATFQEGFDASWSEGRLFGQSVAGENARMDALQDYIGDVKDRTGKDIGANLDYGDSAPGVGPIGVMTASQLLPQVNEAVAKIKNENPNANVTPLTDDDLEQKAVAKSRAAQSAFADVSASEKTTGGKFGLLAGGMANAATDPINLIALPIAPEAETASVLSAALRWGFVGAGAQTAIEGGGAQYREEVQPGYGQSGQPYENVAEAFGGGFVLGGFTKGLANAWTRVKTGQWPTSVRDAGNIIESHENVQQSNVYLGAEGEAAHWDAMNFSINAILDEKPIDVSHIITPQMEAASRNIITRLEGERAASLPIFDTRAIALTSEEAGLRSRDQALASHIETIPEGNATSADRLNRLQAVDQQIANASTPELKKALGARRDQILVDTTPERLQAEAAPFEQRRTAEAERSSIAARLDEISKERDRIQGENLSAAGRPMIGQRMPIRPVPIEQIRASTAAATERAAAERAAAGGEAVPELPFKASEAEGHAQAVQDALVSSVQQVAQKAGYTMPADEAAKIAARLAKSTPDEASDLMRDLQMSPRQVADAPSRMPKVAAEEPREPVTAPDKVVGSPEHDQAMRADIDRERMIEDKQIPVDVDKDGNPVYRSLDAAMDDIDGYKKAADQIAACAAPAAVEEAA